ncbi:MAG TPA: hypothetical protein VL068_12505 [Microthrixaceae bacterium]|nr:hypothetical protein [Microthrixaceae bacterium]
MKKSVVAAGLSAGLIGGGVAGVIFGTPGFAGAQETSTTIAKSTTTTKAADKPPETSPDKSADKSNDEATDKSSKKSAERLAERTAKRTERLQATLGPLVKDGTITQKQADAVVKALLEAAPERDGVRRGRPDGDSMGHRFGRGRLGLGALTDLLGMTPTELGKALADGQTLAKVAESKGVAPQKVIDTLVAEAKKGLDTAVKNGRLTQAEADQKLAEMTKSITDGVNNGSFKMKGGGEGRFGGHNGHVDDEQSDTTAPKTKGD